MSARKILTYLFFLIFLLDALGVIFPDNINRMYTTYFPLPALLFLYFFSVKKLNWYFVMAIVFTYLGVIYFNTAAYYKMGLVFYAIGVFLYVIISLKHAAIISTKSIFIATIPFLIVYLVPLMLYADAVRVDIFNYIMLYVFFVGFFFLISSLIYINQRNKNNIWLLCSGVLFLISTIMHGYNMFFGYVRLLELGVVVTFILMHYAMYRYVIVE